MEKLHEAGTAETWFHFKNQQDMLPFSQQKTPLFISPLAHNDLKKTIILHNSKQKTGQMTQRC